MSRELKFRVWDPNVDSMYTNVGIGQISNYDFDGDRITEQDGLIIMQWTGLKDRNGVEIYEGDIIKGEKINWAESGEYGGMKGTVGVVTFEHARFILEDNESGARPDLAHGSAYHEVIGNIHEHAHLLPKEEEPT